MCAVKENRLEHVFSCVGELATSEVKLIIGELMPWISSHDKKKDKTIDVADVNKMWSYQ